MHEIPAGFTLEAQNTLQQHILNLGHHYQMRDFVLFLWGKTGLDKNLFGFVSLPNHLDFVGLCL